jgi:UDP-glucuronate 4-epimerase
MQNLDKILNVLESYYTFKVNEHSYKLSELHDIDDIIFNIDKIILNAKKNVKIKDSKIYNIGNPQTVNLLSLIKLIEKIIKKNVEKNFMPFQVGDVLKTKANIGKDENKLGFRFKVNIDQGIRKFSKWFLNEK